MITVEKRFVSYPDLVTDLKPRSVIYIDDGLIELKVNRVSDDWVRCRVVVEEHKFTEGVSLPGVDVKLPPLTDEDAEHIKFGIENGVDLVAASFVRKGGHVRRKEISLVLIPTFR